jgi:SAM-dependent methyltransferase
MHVGDFSQGDHGMALMLLTAIINKYEIRSVLDIGAGTGRTIDYLANKHPDIEIKGVEPVKELREQAYKKGIKKEMLVDGDGSKLDFADGAFDIVCEFGVLHHVAKPHLVIDQMLRVAKKGIFISDSNNFGQGNYLSRSLKQSINLFGLWKAFEFIRTKGKMYHISEGDGLFYSYSVFNNYKQIKKKCSVIHLLNTGGNSVNHYRTAPHIALLGVKK